MLTHPPLADQYIELLARARNRRRRLRRVLRRLPRRSNVAQYPVLRHFAAAARRRPYLWSYRPGPVTTAIYAGSIISFLPLVGVTLLLSLAAAMIFRANLTITVALQFVTNPLTSGPLFAGTYFLGDWVLRATGAPALDPFQAVPLSMTVGGVLAGTVFAIALDVALRHMRRKALTDRVSLQRWRHRFDLVTPADPEPSFGS